MPTGTKEAITARAVVIVGGFPIFSGDNELDVAGMSEAVDQAREMYERSFPREVIEDEVGDDGRYYDVGTLLAQWSEGFSDIQAIDYDVGTRITSDETAQFLSRDDGEWGFYKDATITYLEFASRLPSSSVTFRVYYTARHTLDEATSTINELHEAALVYLSVSKFMRIAQLRVEKAIDPPTGNMFVSMRGKGAGFSDIAKAYEDMYFKEIGGEDGEQAVGVVKEYDLYPQSGGQYLFHSGLRR